MGRAVDRGVDRVVHRASPWTSEWGVPRVAGRFSDSEPPGCSQGAQRAVFCAVRVADFLAEGAGWGASPGPGGELGCHSAQQVLKKIVRLASVFPSPPFRSSDFAGLS